MIGFIFNHDVFDEPYNQTAVKKGFDCLEKCIKAMGETPFYSFGQSRTELFLDMSDDYVVIQHTTELSLEQKQMLAQYIKQVLTVKKTIYKKESPMTLVVFEKKDPSDCFVFLNA